MLFFSIEKLNFSKPKELIYLLKELSLGKTYLPKVKALIGKNFLINPIPLLDSDVDINYKLQYIKLAALRSYNDYKIYGVTSLNLSYYPDINLNSIKYNPLLKIERTEIRFLLEELN